MAQSADQILSDAKAASTHADETEAMHKVSPTPVPEGLKPSYTQAREARKSPSISDEVSAKNTMLDKAKEALK